MSHDIFRPRTNPARSIYDAFQKEADKRGGRTISEMITLEREAVFEAAKEQAAILNLKSPTMADVVNAETNASGHTDYAAKWAYGVAETMKKVTA